MAYLLTLINVVHDLSWRCPRILQPLIGGLINPDNYRQIQ